MTRSPRDSMRPWTRNLPSFVLKIFLLLMVLPFLVISAWDGGIKDGWREFKSEWRDAGFPPTKKNISP